ncbi:MAG: GSCFA domain-containing protein [Thermaurantimonas sp.]
MEYHHKIVDLPAVPFSDRLIRPEEPLILVGSCFSDYVGGLLQRLYHPVVVNPMGIVFDPASLLVHFQLVLENKIESKWIFRRDGLYFSWLHHSQIYAATQADLHKRIASARDRMYQGVASARLIAITLGTAFTYRLKHEGMHVANCHKMPAILFEKRLLSVNEISNSLDSLVEAIRRINKDASIIFTVSPVKHLRDGVVDNSRSKAHLISAVHRTIDSTSDVWYYPAYEIVTDVLRNYEYYQEDMAHPTSKAVEVVFSHFLNTCFSKECRLQFGEIDRFLKSLHHQVRIPEADSSKKWFQNLLIEKEKIETSYHIRLAGNDLSRWEALYAQFTSATHT